MKLYITGHAGAAGVLKDKSRYRKLDVILYTNSDYPPPRVIETRARRLLHFSVDDYDHQKEGYIIPSVDTVKDFLEWSVDKDEILCVCHAGISRSSSTAYVIGCSKLGPTKALEFLMPQRHWPNRLIVWYGSKLLDDPKIWQEFVEWQKKFSGLDPEADFHFPEA